MKLSAISIASKYKNIVNKIGTVTTEHLFKWFELTKTSFYLTDRDTNVDEVTLQPKKDRTL